MMIRNSLKQMFRTPFKAFLFFLLILAATILLAFGVNLWWVNVVSLAEFEDIFITVGTVEQNADTIKTERSYDAAKKEYSYYKSAEYGAWIDESVLDFKGANYMTVPKKRPYFGAYMPNFQLYSNEETEAIKYSRGELYAEVVPLTTGPANPIEVKITKVLNGQDYIMAGTSWLCDHYNPEPVVLEAGRTYVMEIGSGGPLHDVDPSYLNLSSEYHIGSGLLSTQCTEEGKNLGTEEAKRIDEVTEDFYETEEGEKWINANKQKEIWNYTVPVQTADRTRLLMPFYNKEVYMTEGRDITDQEYDKGKKVCLVPQKFAQYNHLQVGDELALPLYYANYIDSPSRNFMSGGNPRTFSLLNKDMEIYPVFSSESYEIVGIYEVDLYGKPPYGIGVNEIIIPYQSVTKSWENNIVSSGPMKGYTTTFQIENGQIESFMRQWNKQKIEGLHIVFSDGGYSQLEEGIENRRVTAYIFLAGGGAMVILVLLFFCHMFIARQERRTAIERSLGLSKGRSAVSMLAGLLLIVIAGASAGGAAGCVLTDAIVEQTSVTEHYNTMYTSGIIKDEEEEAEKNHGEKKTVESINAGHAAKGAAAAVGIVVVTEGIISGIYMYNNLKKEPLNLLSCTEE